MDAKKYKVLLCEDDTNLGMVLKNYLELNDYDVTLERDGRLGLAAASHQRGGPRKRERDARVDRVAGCAGALLASGVPWGNIRRGGELPPWNSAHLECRPRAHQSDLRCAAVLRV